MCAYISEGSDCYKLFLSRERERREREREREIVRLFLEQRVREYRC